MLTISKESVEKVVKAPKNPVPNKRAILDGSSNPIMNPSDKEPIKLTVSVPSGNAL